MSLAGHIKSLAGHIRSLAGHIRSYAGQIRQEKGKWKKHIQYYIVSYKDINSIESERLHIQGNFPTLCGIKYLPTCWLKRRHGVQHVEGVDS